MNEFFQKYEQLINSFPLPIRIFILTVAMGIIYLFWNFTLWQPLQEKRTDINNQAQQLTNEIKDIQTQITDLKTKQKEYLAQIQKTSGGKISASTIAGFVEANQIPIILKYLLSFRHNLIFSNVQIMPPTLVQTKVGAKQTSFFTNNIVFKLRGNYFNILNYLQAVERLNWPIYWDRIDYRVENYPLAEIDLQIHFLTE